MKNWIKNIFKKKQPQSAVVDQPATVNPPGAMGMPSIPPARAEAMLQMIANTQETELACDEVHRLLDQYAELALRGEDAASLLPLVHQHLGMCPDCQEEFDALMRMLHAPAE